MKNPACGILNLLAKESKKPSYSGQLSASNCPRRLSHSMHFTLPPQWAAEFPRRMSQIFPQLSSAAQPTLYVQSFIHSSFTSRGGEKSTSRYLEPLGSALLHQIVGEWIAFTFESIERTEFAGLLRLLTSDAALSRVVREGWCVEDMILADNAVELFASQKDVVQALLQQGSSRAVVPDTYASSCLKSFIAAIFLNHSYITAKSFCCESVLPYLR